MIFQAAGGKKEKKKKKGNDFAADQEDPREPEMAVQFISSLPKKVFAFFFYGSIQNIFGRNSYWWQLSALIELESENVFLPVCLSVCLSVC